MAYNFIPTSIKEVVDSIKGPIAQEIGALLSHLQHLFPSVQDPLAIDAASPKSVKITRKIQTKLNLSDLQKNYKLIKLSFGDGSRGGRGLQNKGNLFEYELAKDIEKWWSEGEIEPGENKNLIDDLIKIYKIDKWPTLHVDAEGAENKPRPLMISGKDVIISPGIVDIGAVVTDITLRPTADKSSKPAVYLSLKYSSTVTFFNAGTKKYLTDAELEKGLITNSGGLALLSLFGIDNATFCSVFNGKGKNLYSKDTTSSSNIRAIENLIKSGIGHGFHMVHKLNSKIISKKIDVAYRDKASKVSSVKVFYGGKGGNGARVDIEVTTPSYILKFNFRNKQGGKYISHLMCDYTYIKYIAFNVRLHIH